VKLAWVVFSLTLALFAFQATGALELAVGDECRQGCLDDDEQGRCAESCTDCACCFHPRPIARAEIAHPAAPHALAHASAEASAEYASAPPHEILHVPISLLA
jgi:hypothetical protein